MTAKKAADKPPKEKQAAKKSKPVTKKAASGKKARCVRRLELLLQRLTRPPFLSSWGVTSSMHCSNSCLAVALRYLQSRCREPRGVWVFRTLVK